MHQAISVFDMFKIGIGPSSSHTLGPWRATELYLKQLQEKYSLKDVKELKVFLYGSLAKTGKGHGTDLAIMMGLSGYDPVTVDPNEMQKQLAGISISKSINLSGFQKIDFDPNTCIVFLFNENLPYHPNGMTIATVFNNEESFVQTYYSIGGGFVEQEGLEKGQSSKVELSFPINTSSDLLHWCMKTGLLISEVVKENEMSWSDEKTLSNGLYKIWQTMKDTIYRGCHAHGELPGGLKVKRRAADLNQKLLGHKKYDGFEEWLNNIYAGGNGFNYIVDWVSCFALAVNEENASFGRVVTAPTNGAAGVIPAVLLYLVCFIDHKSEKQVERFLLTASEIGSIFKKGATISAAMGGCQAEIGVSSAMAAAGLCECMGGSQRQVIMAAEIAMEHHLGLTCDPIGGLVQVPCIERNTMGAIKAIAAAQLALQSKPDFAKVSLDTVIKTMWETARDMSSKYKETSDGGLAQQIPLSLSEC